MDYAQLSIGLGGGLAAAWGIDQMPAIQSWSVTQNAALELGVAAAATGVVGLVTHVKYPDFALGFSIGVLAYAVYQGYQSWNTTANSL